MRVAVYYNNRDIRLEERPRPRIGPGELLVRIEASGICGSDVMEWYRIKKAPIVLGHEVAGTVEEVGEGVTTFKKGDRVVATHHVPCNNCRYCKNGHHSLCDTLRTTTFEPGGFSEYVRLPAINVDRGTFLLPDHVTFEAASFVEPLACTVRAQRISGVEPHHTVAVLGAGMSGALHIVLARATGVARILATDVSEFRLEGALRLGANAAIDATDPDLPERIREVNKGRLADQVIVCTAALPAVKQAFECVDRGGTIMFFALVEPGVTFPVPLADIWNKGVTITHSYAGPPDDMRAALDLIASGRVDVTPMVTHRLPLAETQEGFRLVVDAGESLKVIVEPQK
ncbi:MAG: zinc-dependent dehydrogenase [Acidobacteriota bacterium]|nr:zinc-dependent dehydrogenase [Acidobacteriota bacterium]